MFTYIIQQVSMKDYFKVVFMIENVFIVVILSAWTVTLIIACKQCFHWLSI